MITRFHGGPKDGRVEEVAVGGPHGLTALEQRGHAFVTVVYRVTDSTDDDGCVRAVVAYEEQAADPWVSSAT